MGLRRAAYDAVGGYPALPFSVTEDFTLVRAVAEQTPWRVRFPLDARTTVETLPAGSVAEAYAQRRRWARGGLGGGAWVVALYGVVFAVHALLVAGLVVAPAAGLLALAAKAGADAVALGAVHQRAGGRLSAGALVGMEAFQIAYLTTLPFVLALRPGIGWKGRRH